MQLFTSSYTKLQSKISHSRSQSLSGNGSKWSNHTRAKAKAMLLHWFLILSSLPATPSESNFLSTEPIFRDFKSEMAFGFVLSWLDHKVVCKINDFDSMFQLCNKAGVDFAEVTRIAAVHYDSIFTDCWPIRISIPNMQARTMLMESEAQIRNDASVEWMRNVYINSDLTYLGKYIQYLLREEMKLRNKISVKRDEPYYWIVKSKKVLRRYKEYNRKPKDLGNFNLLL